MPGVPDGGRDIAMEHLTSLLLALIGPTQECCIQ